MFYGVEIITGLQDWQVLQRHEGKAKATLKGRWELEKGLCRDWWKRLRSRLPESISSSSWWGWRADITLPQGGPYRLETSLDAVSKATGEHWMFRGDIRVHIGVGDVFCMAGQSNAAGYAKGLAFDPPDVRVHLQRNSGKWDMAAHPMNDATDAADCVNAPMSVTGTSPFLSFGRRYADYTGLPVGLVQAAQGGSPMARWDRRRNGDLYRNMAAKIQAAGGVRAILWYQGCADADQENAAAYADSFARMAEDTRRELGWEIPFFTFQLNRYETQPDAAAWGKIKEIQRQAALNLEKVWILPTAGIPQGDEIHSSAAGNVMLGEMLARQAHGALNGGPAFEAPDVTEARMEGEKIRLTFRNTNFQLTDEQGENAVQNVAAQENELWLTPGRPVVGKAYLSYGAHPQGPEGCIVDAQTYLPILAFDHVEVSV